MPIVVLGMHRSGTSMISRLLNLAGMYLGEVGDMMPVKESNLAGHWEHVKFYELNDRILRRFGGSWDDPPLFPPDWPDMPDLQGLREESSQFVASTFSSDQAWGWKDPRTSLTLPFWRRTIPDLQRFVVCVRNPLDVAASLRARDGTPVGQAMALWQIYTEQSLANTRPEERIVVFYEDFFVDYQRALAPVLKFLGLPPVDAESETGGAMRSFVDASLKHHGHSYEDVMSSWEVPSSAKLLYDTLLHRPRVADQAFPFHSAGQNANLYGVLDREGQRRWEVLQGLVAQIADRDRALQDAGAHLEELLLQIADRDRAMAEAQGHVDGLQRAIQDRDVEIAEAQGHVAELTLNIESKDRELQGVAGHVDELLDDLGKKQEELDTAAVHVAELTERLEGRDRLVRTLALHTRELPDQLTDADEVAELLEASIDRRAREVEDLRAELREREEAIKILSTELTGREGSGLEFSTQLADLRNQLAEKERLLLEFSVGLSGWEEHWAGVQNSLAWRRGAMPLRQMRRLVAPEGTLRERAWWRVRGREMVVRPETRAVSPPALPTEEAREAPGADTGASEAPAVEVRQPVVEASSWDRSFDIVARARLRAFLAGDQKLGFPAVTHPQVTVIVPLHNHAEQTLMTLESLLAAGGEVPYEVILVDNGSADETLELLLRLENVRVHRNEENLGFGEACNRGAEMALGEYVCFLNSDALPSPGWLGALLDTLERFPRCRAVGGKLVLPDGSLQEAGSIIWKDGSTLGYGRGRDPMAPEFCYTREVDYCSAACLLVDRELFQSLGGFDARYAPAYYEDADLCMAIREAGYTVMYEPRAAILHLEHGSSNRGNAVALQLRNRERFAEKWKRRLAGRGMPGALSELVHRDSRTGKRLLVIDDRVPEHRLGSGFPRTRALLDALAKTEYVVSFLPTADPTPVQPATTELQQLGVEVLYGVTDVDAKLDERANLYHAAIVSRPHNARFINTVQRTNPDAAIIYDAEAVYALRDAAQAHIQGSQIMEEVVEAAVRAELAPVSSAELVLTVSEVERNVILSHCPGTPVRVWGHAVPVYPAAGNFDGRRDILLVGYLGSQPNADAVLYLLDAVMPLVFEMVDCRLVVVGAGASETIRKAVKRFSGRVEMKGFVPELDQIYDSARLFVAPHRFAAGIPIKVVEAMSRGLPCVVSPLLARQLGMDGTRGILAGGNPVELAQAVIDLYQDRELWQRVHGGAIDFVREHHDPERMKTQLEQWVTESISKKLSRTLILASGD